MNLFLALNRFSLRDLAIINPRDNQDSLPCEIPNCMTVDVEDYFQVSGFADRVSRKDWDRYECRVEKNTDRILKLFDEFETRGTFFILGWVAERFPKLVRRIATSGHEIASHGYWHQLVYDLSPEEFSKDLTDSKDAIFNACGVEVKAYRAPSFSIVPKSSWALQVLVEHGFEVDSSIFPIRGHVRYGDPDGIREIHEIKINESRLFEFPPTAWHVGGRSIPIGGGYFRLFPFGLTCLAMKRIRQGTGPAMFYLHPWEVDPEQPRINGRWQNRFRHYVGLQRVIPRMRKLLAQFEFETLSEVIDRFVHKNSAALKVREVAGISFN